MPKIIDYILIYGETSDELSKGIRIHLKDDWELYGFPFTDGYIDIEGRLKDITVQAMIKYENKNDKNT